MTRFYLFSLLWITFGLLFQSCEKTAVDPEFVGYPMDLTIISENSSAELHWTELTVSSFEEYIIVRSVDSIPDSPIPELIGNATIVTRIDKAGTTEFIDFSPPISKRVFYKVYGKIGDRYLPSQTVRIDLSVQIIPYRADVSEIDKANNEIVAYDRSSQTLFVYNYKTEKIRVQKFISFSNPIIRIGQYNGQDEIYITDQSGVMYIYNPNNLNLSRSSNQFPSVANFIYDEGRFILARFNGSIAVMDRKTLQIKDTEFGIINQRSIYTGIRNGENLEILEIGINRVNRYVLTENNLQLLSTNADFPSGFQLNTGRHPDGSQFIVNSSGLIINGNLDLIATLENGVQFYSQVAYSQDARRIITVGRQLNVFVLKFFDVNDEYALLSENDISSSPIKIFSDDESAYLISIVFLNGGVRTLISKYSIP